MILPFDIPFAFLLLFPLLLGAILKHEEHDERNGAGYPVGNFGICGQIDLTGRFLPRVLVNPGEQGPWLQEMIGGNLVVKSGEVSLHTQDFETVHAVRSWPNVLLQLSDPQFPGVEMDVSSFSPIAVNDPFPCSLPVILTEISIHNSGSEPLTLTVSFEPIEGSAVSAFAEVGTSSPCCAAGFVSGNQVTALEAPLDLSPGERTNIRFLIAYHHPNGFYKSRFRSITDLAAFAIDHWDELKESTAAFDRLLPSTGDDQLDSYLRWYISAGVYLTRITDSFVITMGYCELNQRDSYWTSWLHLLYWPDLEKRMLEETAEHMRPDGKVPTTILPIIERDDDLDINCYFVLRVKRYFDHTRDRELVTRIWPYVKKAISWLESRDMDGDGMLDQGSFWGDWKDVTGVEGRRNAPHFEFTWLGTLRFGAELARLVGDSSAAEEYTEMSNRTSEAINRDVKDGGLWNGKFYTSQWYDGREDNHWQQDQLVGAVLDLIPKDRLKSIYTTVPEAWAEWGIRETYPYREPFNNIPGEYHNGGVWPFLSFMDALGRFRYGYPDQAEDILRRTGRWDLEAFGDYTPHEYLMGETGENRGPVIQGWNADYIAAVVWGMFGVQMLDDSTVQISPRVPAERTFRTPLVLSCGLIWMENESGRGITLASECDRKLEVRFGQWSRSTQKDAPAEPLGDGFITWKTLSLEPGQTLSV